MLLAVLLAAVVSVVCDRGEDTHDYGIVIEANLVETVAHIYFWEHKDETDEDLIDVEAAHSPTSKRVWRMAVTPSLLELSKDTTDANYVQTYLAPLISFARSNIPAHKHHVTLLFFKCTDGIRQEPVETRQRIIEDVNRFLATTPFATAAHRNGVLSGELEAHYTWVSFNAVLGTLDMNNSAMIFDISGHSSRFVFANHDLVDYNAAGVPSAQTDTQRANKNFFAVSKQWVHSVSFPNSGDEQFWDAACLLLVRAYDFNNDVTYNNNNNNNNNNYNNNNYNNNNNNNNYNNNNNPNKRGKQFVLDHPCLPTGFSFSTVMDGLFIRFRGTSNYLKCSQLVDRVAAGSAEYHSNMTREAMASRYSSGTLYAEGVAQDTAQILLGPTSPGNKLAVIRISALSICNLDWNTVSSHVAIVPTAHVPLHRLCFLGLLVPALLTQTLGFSDSTVLALPNNVNNLAAGGWQHGLMVVEVYLMPAFQRCVHYATCPACKLDPKCGWCVASRSCSPNAPEYELRCDAARHPWNTCSVDSNMTGVYIILVVIAGTVSCILLVIVCVGLNGRHRASRLRRHASADADYDENNDDDDDDDDDNRGHDDDGKSYARELNALQHTDNTVLHLDDDVERVPLVGSPSSSPSSSSSSSSRRK